MFIEHGGGYSCDFKEIKKFRYSTDHPGSRGFGFGGFLRAVFHLRKGDLSFE